MFEVKGTGLLGLLGFVKNTFGGAEYVRWLDGLSPEARQLAERSISASDWYSGPLSLEMRRAIIDRFFGGDISGIRALGRYSGEQGLKGIYRLAIKVGSPSWVVGRLSIVFGSYFRPGEAFLVVNEPKHIIAELRDFPDRSGIMEHVFCGFIEVALELSGAKDVQVNVVKSLVDSPNAAQVEMRWG